jgi:hypothetical protein
MTVYKIVSSAGAPQMSSMVTDPPLSDSIALAAPTNTTWATP